MKALVALGLALSLAFSASTAFAADSLAWPQFRGPAGSGVAEGQNPPLELGPDKNVKWKIAVPSGLSSPIVAGNSLVITAFDDEKLFTIAYDRESGKEVWRRQAPAKEIEKYYKAEGSPASSTPATDGQRIVSYFGSCGLVCYDLEGNEQWTYELPPVVLPGNFGSGVSPIIVDGVVVLVRDETNDPRIMAVDVRTGELKWERKRQSPVSYCTPVVWDTPEGKQIAAAGHARMSGYDLKTGDEKWTVGGVPSGCCPSPVVADGVLYFAGWSPGGADDSDFQMPTFDALLKDFDGDKDGALSRAEGGQAFQGFFDSQDANQDGSITREEHEAVLKFMTAGKNSAFALRPGGAGDITESHVIWSHTKGMPYIPSAIAIDGQYVMIKDGGILTAFDLKSGKQIYMERAITSGSYYASPVAANGRIYFTSLDVGVVSVVKSGADKPEVLAKNPPLGERVSATPAIADDTIYIRTAGHLYAFAEK